MHSAYRLGTTIVYEKLTKSVLSTSLHEPRSHLHTGNLTVNAIDVLDDTHAYEVVNCLDIN